MCTHPPFAAMMTATDRARLAGVERGGSGKGGNAAGGKGTTGGGKGDRQSPQQPQQKGQGGPGGQGQPSSQQQQQQQQHQQQSQGGFHAKYDLSDVIGAFLETFGCAWTESTLTS